MKESKDSSISVTAPVSIQEIINELDILIKDHFVLGVFKAEYGPYASQRRKTFSDFSDIIPNIKINHLRFDPNHKIHFPLFADICEIFDKLKVIQSDKESNKVKIDKVIDILKSIDLQKDKRAFMECSFLEKDILKQAARLKEHQKIISAMTDYVSKSLQKIEAIKSTQKPSALPKKTEGNPSSPKKEEVALSSEDATIGLAKTNLNNELNCVRENIKYWEEQIRKKRVSKNSIQKIITKMVARLDIFIKDEFMLKVFAKDYNTSIRKEPTFEQLHHGKTNFSLYKKAFFSDNTTLNYLSNSYPNDFPAFQQMVNLLDEIKKIETTQTSLTQIELLYSIIDRFNRFSAPEWMIQDKLGHGQKATLDVISYMDSYLKKINKMLDDCKSAYSYKDNSSLLFTPAVSQQQQPTVKEEVKPVEQKTTTHENISLGNDLIGQVATTFNRTAIWAQNWWNGTQEQTPQQVSTNDAKTLGIF